MVKQYCSRINSGALVGSWLRSTCALVNIPLIYLLIVFGCIESSTIWRIYVAWNFSLSQIYHQLFEKLRFISLLPLKTFRNSEIYISSEVPVCHLAFRIIFCLDLVSFQCICRLFQIRLFKLASSYFQSYVLHGKFSLSRSTIYQQLSKSENLSLLCCPLKTFRNSEIYISRS
jgi:hypothetical protein